MTVSSHLRKAGWQLRAAAEALTAAPPGDGDLFDHVVTGDWSAAEINDAMWQLVQDRDGGDVLFDGHIVATEPILHPPGVTVHRAGYLNAWSRSRTCILKAHGGPGWDFTDLGRYDNGFGSGRSAWFGQRLNGMQIDCLGNDGPAFRKLGGNCAWLQDMSVIGSPEIGYLVEDGAGRDYDGQYTAITNLWVKHYRRRGVWAQRGSPDHLFMHGWVYGTQEPGQVGVQLESGGDTRSSANNFTFIDFHTQFAEVGLDVDSKECVWIGGSWENKSGSSLISDEAVAVRVGPNARWFVMSHTSFANKSSVGGRMFQIDPAAKRLRFRDLTGINEGDVPAGFERYFDVVPD